ncbi:unnamed protein product [Closterium sp. NIES-65]|nr:unnamed protein product [Closterium sp. NIES-65]
MKDGEIALVYCPSYFPSFPLFPLPSPLFPLPNPLPSPSPSPSPPPPLPLPIRPTVLAMLRRWTSSMKKINLVDVMKIKTAGERDEQASSMKKINLVDVMKIETAGERDEQVLLHTKSRVWQLLVDGESDQFASTVQRNAKMYLQKHIPVQRVTGEEILIVTNARAESLRASPVLYEFSVVKNNDPASGMQRERSRYPLRTTTLPAGRGEDPDEILLLPPLLPMVSPPLSFNPPSHQRASPVLYEFSVVKNNDPASGMQRERTLVLTKEFMAEMTGSHVIALHSLSGILGLVVLDKSEREAIVELSGWLPLFPRLTQLYPPLLLLLAPCCRGVFCTHLCPSSLSDILGLVVSDKVVSDKSESEAIVELSGWLPLLSDILGLVVSDKNESEVIVELSGWRATQYCVADREALVGSLAEVASHAKARNFSVRLEPFAQHTLPEKPLPLYQNEYEIYLIARFMTVFLAHRENLSELTQADVVAQWLPMVKEYACNMHPGDSLCIDARPMLAVAEMLRASLDLKPGLGASYAVTCCSVVQRLLGTRGVFESVKSNPDFISILIKKGKHCVFESVKANPDFISILVKALKHPSSVVAFAAANTIRAAIKHYSADSPAPDSPAAARASTTSSFLMQAWPAHAEAANKHVVLSGDNLQVLVARLQTDALVHQNALQVCVCVKGEVQGILEILTLALHLPPSSDAEAEKHWMEAPPFSPSISVSFALFFLSSNHSLYSIWLPYPSLPSPFSTRNLSPKYPSPCSRYFPQCPCSPLTSNALLIKTIFTRCSPAFITRFRTVILSRAVVLLLLKNALFNKLERARDVSAELLFLIAESDAKTQLLLANLLPKGGLYFMHRALVSEAAKACRSRRRQALPLHPGSKSQQQVAAAAAAAATASTTTGTAPGSGTAAGEGSVGERWGWGVGVEGWGVWWRWGWKEALEMLRRRSITTPVLVWNDAKRHELHAYLKEQVEAFDAALGRTGGGKDIHFNTDDCECLLHPCQ